jgi:hypothetical protein
MCPTGAAWTSRAVKDYQGHTDRAVVAYQSTFLDGLELEPVQVRVQGIVITPPRREARSRVWDAL